LLPDFRQNPINSHKFHKLRNPEASIFFKPEGKPAEKMLQFMGGVPSLLERIYLKQQPSFPLGGEQ